MMGVSLEDNVMKRILWVAGFLSVVSLAQAGGVVCAMGGHPKIETPGLVDLLNEGDISHERLDDIRLLQERLAPRFDAVKGVFVAYGPEAVLKGATVAEIVESDMADRLRGVCFVVPPQDDLFRLATEGYSGYEQAADGSYHATGKLEACELCSAVQSAAFRPLDAHEEAGGELPGARVARAHEANAVLAAWREGLRAILSAEEWNKLESFQRDWLHKSITTTIAADPRVKDACEECLKLKCSLCAAVLEGVRMAQQAKE